jgi:tRNA pseudouridine32 synthase/23S rRNA pseudouridine746 synthase
LGWLLMFNIPILYEHSDFIIIDKPAGIPVQDEAELLGIIPRMCEQLKLPKLWLVHRLDKVTSGILILAKNQAAASQLSALFANRKIEKFYLAISHKKPSKKQGCVAGDMKKVRNGVWMLTKHLLQPSVTQFESVGLGQGLRLFLVKPITGKTHQIRVMMKSLGSPIIGDLAYKGIISDRTYLHAFAIRFTYDGQEFEFNCIPDEGDLFKQSDTISAMKENAQPWQRCWPKVKDSLINKITPSRLTID